MLTATPINNRVTDLRHMIELFTGANDTYFRSTLGVNSLTAHFRQIESDLLEVVQLEETDSRSIHPLVLA